MTTVGVNYICTPKIPSISIAVFAVPVFFANCGGMQLYSDLKDANKCGVCFCAPIDNSNLTPRVVDAINEHIDECLRVFPAGVSHAHTCMVDR